MIVIIVTLLVKWFPRSQLSQLVRDRCPGLWCYSELCRRSSDCDVSLFTKLTWFYYRFSWPCIISYATAVVVTFCQSVLSLIITILIWYQTESNLACRVVSFVCYFKSMIYFTRRPWLSYSIRLLSRHYRPMEQAKIELGSVDCMEALLICDRLGPFAKSATEDTEALTISGRPGPLPLIRPCMLPGNMYLFVSSNRRATN